MRGHFDGGSWDPRVDAWDGAKHRALRELADSVLRERATAARVRELLGEPDAIVAAGARLNDAQGRPSGVLWLYNWRGERDRLAIAVDAGRVVGTGWVFALER